MARGKLAVWAAVLVWSVGLQAQPVYKWVDANGKTHYGSQPPADKDDAAPMKLQGTNGTTTGSASGPAGSGGGKSTSTKGVEYNADGTKKIPEGVKDMAEGLRKSLGTVDSKQVPMNCAVAVSCLGYVQTPKPKLPLNMMVINRLPLTPWFYQRSMIQASRKQTCKKR